MIAQLGNIEFEVLDLQEGMALSRKYGYKEHAVIEGKSKLQYIGESLKKMQIIIGLHADFCDPESKLRELENEAAKHSSMSFIMSNGKYFGEFVIETIDIKYEKTDGKGGIISLTASLSLTEHVSIKIKNMKSPSNNGYPTVKKPKDNKDNNNLVTLARQ